MISALSRGHLAGPTHGLDRTGFLAPTPRGRIDTGSSPAGARPRSRVPDPRPAADSGREKVRQPNGERRQGRLPRGSRRTDFPFELIELRRKDVCCQALVVHVTRAATCVPGVSSSVFPSPTLGCAVCMCHLTEAPCSSPISSSTWDQQQEFLLFPSVNDPNAGSTDLLTCCGSSPTGPPRWPCRSRRRNRMTLASTAGTETPSAPMKVRHACPRRCA